MTRYATSLKFGDKYCLDPRGLYESASRLQHSNEPWSGRVNSFRTSRGPNPGRGWALLKRSDAEALDLSTTHSFVFTFGETTVTLTGLYITQFYSVYTKMDEAGDNAPTIVEFADKRILFGNSVADTWYNVRMAAPPRVGNGTLHADYCYTDSLNSSALWTWETLLSDLWDQLPGTPGTWPGLANDFTSKPENIHLRGVSAWSALNALLAHTGNCIVHDPTDDSFSIVGTGDVQLGVSSLSGNSRLVSHSYTEPGTAANRPEKVEVFFPRKDEHYGTEPDLKASGNWLNTPAYSKQVATGLTGAVTGTILPVWDETAAIYTHSGTVANSADCDARAAEVAAQIANEIEDGDYHEVIQIVGPSTSILPGAQVEEVAWFDIGSRLGMVTEYALRPLYRGTRPPVTGTATAGPVVNGDPALAGPYSHLRPHLPGPVDRLLPPELSRHFTPCYPEPTRVVQVTASTGAAEGIDTTYGIFSGAYYRINPEADLTFETAPFTSEGSCYILPLNSPWNTNRLRYLHNQRFVGRLVGSLDISGTAYPLFVVDEGLQVEYFYMTAQLIPYGSAAAYRRYWNGSAWVNSSTYTLTVYDATGAFYKPASLDSTSTSTDGCRGIAILNRQNHRFQIVEMETPADQINVTLAENMGYTTAGQAEVTLNDFYRGQSPLLFWAEADIPVKDPQGLFPRALDGAKAKATYDSEDEEYHLVECQQMATMLKAKVDEASGVATSDSTFAVDTLKVMFPITGQDPENGDLTTDPTVVEVQNTFSREYEDNDDLIIAWNEEDDQWEDITPGDPGNGQIQWAKVQSGFTNQAGSSKRSVTVQECDVDGNNATGSTFTVYTPLRDNQDTALFTDYVVGWMEDPDGTKVIVTPCFDDPIGTIKMVNADSAIRDGWRLCDTSATTNMEAYSPVGFKSGDANFGAIGNTYGNTSHHHEDGTSLDGDDDHKINFGCQGDTLSAGGFDVLSIDDHVDETNYHPVRTLKFIERYQ